MRSSHTGNKNLKIIKTKLFCLDICQRLTKLHSYLGNEVSYFVVRYSKSYLLRLKTFAYIVHISYAITFSKFN